MAFLSGYNYRKKHTIDSSSDGSLSNYQKKITVHYGSGTDSGQDVYLDGNCESDFSDVRFTDDSGDTELSQYLVQKIDSDKALFYVEIPSIPSSGGVDIYLYYGNSSASLKSNGNDTFFNFDDFESTPFVFDTAGGSAINLVQQSTTVKEGSNAAENDDGSQDYKIQMQDNTDYSPDGYKIEGWVYCESGGGSNENLGPGLTVCASAGTDNGYQVLLDNRDSVSPQIREDLDYSSRTDGSYQTSLDTWYLLSIFREGTDLIAELWTETDVYGSSPTSTTTRASEETYSTGRHGLTTYNATHSVWDAVWMRNRTDDEPTHGSWGTQEEQSETVAVDDVSFSYATPSVSTDISDSININENVSINQTTVSSQDIDINYIRGPQIN